VKRRTPLLLALVAGLALAGSGCMGDDASPDEYEATVVQTRNDVDEALTKIAEARNRQQFIASMKQASVVASRAADELGDAGVPDEFEDENDKLTAALESLATDLEGTAGQLELTPELFEQAGFSFEGWTTANQVFSSLREQGLEIPALEAR
jgi:ABC-type Na+ efflux pump permease subunit